MVCPSVRVTSRAHPRSRGENLDVSVREHAGAGSSPLTRGKRDEGGASRRVRRLIPAHAGKTRYQAKASSAIAAHPRSRGENPSSVPSSWYSFGSSPLTRGKPPSAPVMYPCTRLIPAHAGKTPRRLPIRSRRPAHPRSRGENQTHPLCGFEPGGSSPLTRGKQRLPRRRARMIRLIPAHAGKTPRRACAAASVWAHPRSRGENESIWRARIGGGSSPLTRGKPATIRSYMRKGRLIPAHAGKTPDDLRRQHHRTAHPRSRGENLANARIETPSLGSSPLTRGKPSCPAATSRMSRLIPAHAGKTRTSCRAATLRRAHPRSRGENNTTLTLSTWNDGSSPLTRGKH